MYVCMYVCMYACMCVCVRVSVFVVHTHCVLYNNTTMEILYIYIHRARDRYSLALCIYI